MLVTDQTEPILKKVFDNKANVQQLQEKEKETTDRLRLLEKIVFNNEGGEGEKFQVLEDIWSRLVQLENVPRFAEEKIKMSCLNMVQAELEDPKVVIREFSNQRESLAKRLEELEEDVRQYKERTREELVAFHQNLQNERRDRFEYQKQFSSTQTEHTQRIRKLEQDST
jgi:hypothetical protein